MPEPHFLCSCYARCRVGTLPNGPRISRERQGRRGGCLADASPGAVYVTAQFVGSIR